MKVYIAGPMTGLPNKNFEAFDKAKREWQALGHTVFSPADIDRALGYTDDVLFTNKEVIRHLIATDFDCIYNCDAIALLPGWRKSKGATAELALALFLGLKVYCAAKMKEMWVAPLPWGEFPMSSMTMESIDAPKNP